MNEPVVKYWSRRSGWVFASATSRTSSGSRVAATLAGDALPDRDARALGNVRRDAARRGEVQRLAVRRAQHQRAALRVHVVADERQQSVGELPRIVRRSRRA